MTDAQDVIRGLVSSLIGLADSFEAAKTKFSGDGLVDAVRKESNQIDPFLLREIGEMLGGVCSGVPSSPMKRLITRLLAEAPDLLKLPDGTPLPDQTPALDCVVFLSGSPHPFRGALSTTPEGTLRLLGPGNDGQGPVLVEQFFPYASVVALGVMRKLTAERSSIISAFETPS